jgi:hypothetical protein
MVLGMMKLNEKGPLMNASPELAEMLELPKKDFKVDTTRML